MAKEVKVDVNRDTISKGGIIYREQRKTVGKQVVKFKVPVGLTARGVERQKKKQERAAKKANKGAKKPAAKRAPKTKPKSARAKRSTAKGEQLTML